MNKFYSVLMATLVAVFMVGCNAEVKPAQPSKPQDIQIFSADNSDGKITVKSIEDGFKSVGMTVVGNNNMNAPFTQRFNDGKDYDTYRLMFAHNTDLVAKLVTDYPSIGLIAPLSTSVYSKDGSVMNISTLTLQGMSKITGIPQDNAILKQISANMDAALKAAMPNGAFKFVDYKINKPGGPLVTSFKTTNIQGEDEDELEESKEGFQEEMEAELEPVGFIVAGFVSLNDKFNGTEAEGVFDFYDTYSLCKLDVIYPVHEVHPEVGAFAPCTLYMYKKAGEDETYMGYPSVHNWISSVDIEDAHSIDPLIKAQGMLERIIGELTAE